MPHLGVPCPRFGMAAGALFVLRPGPHLFPARHGLRRSPLSNRPNGERPRYSACAPETTSMISRVMAACRTLFMYSVSCSIMSAEFFVAVSIAVIDAA